MTNSIDKTGKTERFGEGQTLMVLGMPHIVKVWSEQNVARTSVMETVIPPGLGVPLHTHANEDEFFCVLQGELTVQMAGWAEPKTLKPGDFVFLPRSSTHGFINASREETRMLVTVTPGTGSDGMFKDLAKACETCTDAQKLFPEVGRICASYGVVFAPMER